MNGIDYSLNLLLYPHNKLLVFGLDMPLSLYGINDSLDFPLTFHKHKCKSGTTVKKEKTTLMESEHTVPMKKN